MAFDAGMLSFVLNEINNITKGGKVEKIYQPARDELVFILRSYGSTERLLINAGSRCPRINITSQKSENPVKAPMLCMLLRKHLQGAVFIGASQLGFERAARLSFDAFDDMGFKCEKHIIVEMMGKYSNIILTDHNDVIITVLRQVDFTQSLRRQLLPGMIYELPPAQDKIDPLSVDDYEFNRLAGNTESERPCEKFIMSNFSGISPLVAREIAMLSGGSPGATLEECAPKLKDVFFSVISSIIRSEGSPVILFDENYFPKEYCFMPITQYGSSYAMKQYGTFGEMLDTYFEARSRDEKISQKAADILKILSAAEARLTKKYQLQQAELSECDKGETHRLYGDLITANIYRLKRGMEGCALENYMDGSTVEIALDSRLTPAQNAQRYYKKYQKSKSAKAHLTEQIRLCESELIYIATVRDALSRAETEKELTEIRSELYHSGYASRMKQFAEKKQTKPSYLTFRTTNGYTVLCGKNNIANDWLTFKNAEKGDWWFHAKNLPGSHVIMECAGLPEPPAEDFTEACIIAAVHSKAGEGAFADVDYTYVKHVKKPPNAKPGYVIYHTNWSATVPVDREAAQKLLVKQ
ncbi:MAG: NFACT family protein [Clostridia bacterium]|nr:NFACT family protein [Clostridia bacterium]